MKKITASLLLMLAFAGFAQAQAGSGFYLELDSCNACGAYGNQIVRLLKQNSVNAFNAYAQCSGSCFSTGQYANANKIIRSKSQGSVVMVMVGPFKTLDSAFDVMKRLKSILQPVFNDSWKQGWGNSSLTHDHGNAYNISPLSIYIVKFGTERRAGSSSSAGDWQSFWTDFRAAVNKRDRTALRRMMSGSFGNGNTLNATPNQVFADLDSSDGEGWRALERTIARRPVPFKSPNSSRLARVVKNPLPCGKRPCRYTQWAIFELVNGRWLWTALIAPGD